MKARTLFQTAAMTLCTSAIVIGCLKFYDWAFSNTENAKVETVKTYSKEGAVSTRQTLDALENNVYFLQLGEEEKNICRQMAAGISGFEETVVFDQGVETQTFTKLYQILYWQMPQLFQISRGADTSYSLLDDKVVSFSVVYAMDQNEYLLEKAKIEQIADYVKNECKEKSAYETELWIHDYLASIITYDEEAENGHSITGALLEGRAVCEGYSLAFQYLLEQCGIPSFTIIGYASSAQSGSNAQSEDSTGHSWNGVYLDDGWYYTDVTWDDQDGRKNTDLTSHTFFNLTYQEMSAERDDSQSEIFGEMPKENNTAYNYYVYNNLVIDSPSQFVELLSQAFQKEQNSLVEVRFANRQVYEKVKNGMDEYFNAAAAKAFAVDTINWPQCGYICRDSLLQIEEIIILAK